MIQPSFPVVWRSLWGYRWIFPTWAKRYETFCRGVAPPDSEANPFYLIGGCDPTLFSSDCSEEEGLDSTCRVLYRLSRHLFDLVICNHQNLMRGKTRIRALHEDCPRNASCQSSRRRTCLPSSVRIDSENRKPRSNGWMTEMAYRPYSRLACLPWRYCPLLSV